MRSQKQTFGPWSGDRSGPLAPHFGGRLSLTTATPVTTADVTAAASLYYTEHLSAMVTLPWRPGRWETFELPRNPAGVAEIKADFLANSPWALANATAYDVFLRLGVAGPELVRGPAWSSGTARATGLVRSRAGALVLATDPRMVWVGTIYASAANQCEDSAAKRFVWNTYNQVARPMKVVEATNSWTYTTAAYRQVNASSANQIEFVHGLAEKPVTARAKSFAANSLGAVGVSTGIGLDSTTATSTTLHGGATIIAGAVASIDGEYRSVPGIGYHYLAWLEFSNASGTTTWYGDNGTPTELQAGLVAEILG